MNNSNRKTSPAGRGIDISNANLSHALVWLGVAVTALLVMFRPAGAQALLPSSALVYTDSKATEQFTVKFDGKPTITRDYDVVLKGKKTPTKVTLTGVPLASILGDLGDKLDLSKVPYV
ncbi:MAG: hypothetical protein JJE27_05950, partial [Thermoleophilia bacterium]|nr:hypothetical protein [Thermoleophilia bacterium]